VGADGEVTRRRILDAAMEQFARHGYAQATLSDIAASAGVTSGALYYYFDNKPALIRSLFEEHTREVVARFSAAAESGTSFRNSVVRVLQASTRIGAENPYAAAFTASMVADGTRYPELQEALLASLKKLDDVFLALASRAAERGEIAGGANPQSIADMLSALHHGMASLGVHVKGRRYSAALQRIVDLVDGDLFAGETGDDPSTA
jgi:AcrR family transcriptional regulator